MNNPPVPLDLLTHLDYVLGRDSGVVVDCVVSLILYLPRHSFSHEQLESEESFIVICLCRTGARKE